MISSSINMTINNVLARFNRRMLNKAKAASLEAVYDLYILFNVKMCNLFVDIELNLTSRVIIQAKQFQRTVERNATLCTVRYGLFFWHAYFLCTTKTTIESLHKTTRKTFPFSPCFPYCCDGFPTNFTIFFAIIFFSPSIPNNILSGVGFENISVQN